MAPPNPNIAGFLSFTIWGFANLLVVLTGGVPPFLLAFTAMFSGGLLLLFISAARGARLRAIWRQRPSAYLSACGGIGGYTILIYMAFKYASPFEVNMINYLWPVFLVILSALLYGEKFPPLRICGIVSGFAGMVLLFADGLDDFTRDNLPGYGIALAAAMVWALYSATRRKVDFPGAFVGAALLITSFAALACHLMFEETVWPQGWGVWMMIAALGASRSAYTLWDYAMKHGDVTLLASCSYLVPFLSAGLFIIFGFAPANMMTALAGALILGGSLLVNAPRIGAALKEWKARQA